MFPEGANKTLAEMDMYEYAKYDYMRHSFEELIMRLSETEPIYRTYTIEDYLRNKQ